MQIVTDEALSSRMLTTLPRVLLFAIAAAPAHIGQLKQRMQRWWPGSSPIGEQVDVLVRAYLERGDVQRRKNGVISCVPPFVVVKDEAASTMELFGNPLIEDVLRELARPSVRVRYFLEGNFPYRRVESRAGTLPISLLSEHGVAVFTYADVIERVPFVSRLSMPSSEECLPLPVDGRWEVYDPTNSSAEFQGGRWMPFEHTVQGGFLVRQVSSDRASGRNIEYYLYAGMGRGRHIDEDEARLWQFAIDWRADRPIPWRWNHGAGVTINGRLPAPVETALRLISTGPIRREKYLITYPVPSSARPAVDSLAIRLGTMLA